VDLIFEQLNPRGCKTYLIASKRTSEAWLVDPVLDYIEEYMRTLESLKLKLSFAIDTHTHADHISGSPKLTDITGCAYLMHSTAQPKQVTDRVGDRTQLYLDGELVHVMHTPGHTRDSLCLIMPDRILTGDTLFLDEGGAGRDDLPGGDAAIHWESLQRLKELHDNVVVHPGHDYRNRRPSTIREQKQRNPFFKPRSQAEYIRFVEELKLGPADWMKEVLKANVHCTRERGGLHIPADVSACEAQGTLQCNGQAEPTQIDAHLLRGRLDAKENLLLLDVREHAELSEELGHIAGITHIPVGLVVQRLLELKPHAEREIVVICKMGGRARSAAKILQSEGFPSVRVLSGGMIAWNNAGLPVQRSWSAVPVSSSSAVSS
jgi:glyoxylase-like metal-dependent hydrolase (beta-lactamase superfamily II)/rhodanese-related sulfurtransferase